MVSGDKQLVESRNQVGILVKLGISWDGSTRYLDISPPTRADVERLSYLQITSGEPYSPYIPFVIYTRHFKLNDTCSARDILKNVWTNEMKQ